MFVRCNKANWRAHLDLLVVADAGKYALTHAAENTGGVAGGLVHAELDVLAAEEEGAATEEDGGRLCGDAGAGAALREEEGDGLVEERLGGHTQTRIFLVPGLRGEPGQRDLLERVRMADQPQNLRAGEVGHAHEMRHWRHFVSSCVS